jgi:hypothetical protein
MQKFCFHKLGCGLMESSVSIDLIVVLWKVLFPWTWLWSYGRFCFRRLGCGLMEGSVSVDLVVILWKVLFP